ncbi:606_t:CDS:2, partial [Funneliformis mosseae]
WDGDVNIGSRERFLAHFLSQEKLHRWQYELMNLKQGNEKKLANRVDAGGIPDIFKVRMFLSGLNNELATLVAIQNLVNLDAAITQAKTSSSMTVLLVDTCTGIKFISPRANEILANYQDYKVEFKIEKRGTIVQGLDLYDEKGNFVESLKPAKGTDSLSNIEYGAWTYVKLEVPSSIPLPARFKLKVLATTKDDLPCSKFRNDADHKEFHAHSVVLYSRSSYFHRSGGFIFENDWSDSTGTNNFLFSIKIDEYTYEPNIIRDNDKNRFYHSFIEAFKSSNGFKDCSGKFFL